MHVTWAKTCEATLKLHEQHNRRRIIYERYWENKAHTCTPPHSSEAKENRNMFIACRNAIISPSTDPTSTTLLARPIYRWTNTHTREHANECGVHKQRSSPDFGAFSIPYTLTHSTDVNLGQDNNLIVLWSFSSSCRSARIGLTMHDSECLA